MPESDLKIFDGHRMILEDEEFVGRIRDIVANGFAAESALFRVIDELSASMLAVADDYLRERATDFRDVGHRVLRHLRQDEKRAPFGKPTIIVAEELTLSQLTLVIARKPRRASRCNRAASPRMPRFLRARSKSRPWSASNT